MQKLRYKQYLYSRVKKWKQTPGNREMLKMYLLQYNAVNNIMLLNNIN